uniref:GLIPR1 like 1 n=1 Tax=Astyanax mexicanus TaxID=7994 RepID=A0A8B9HUM0_ASTMX
MMGAWSRALTCLTLLLATPALTTDITDLPFIKTCVTEHNQHRANVQPAASNMRYMTWDEGLAVTARAWARKCLFIHNTHLKEGGRVHPVFSSVGENLWAGTHFSVQGAIKSWADEVKDYSYSTMTCKQVCGHYTQVVWANTYKVGCAVQYCPNGVEQTPFYPRQAFIFVCNYGTAGNVFNQKPYRTGPECRDCTGELCENRLCRNTDRDALRSESIFKSSIKESEILTEGHTSHSMYMCVCVCADYNWTPDWDPALSECGSLCKAVLITRPVSLLVIFISVYCIQRRYPDLFAYT